MRSTPFRIALVAAVFVAALGGALLVMKSETRDGGSASDPPAGRSITSDIWKVGDEWTVQVRQDAGAITPAGDRSVAAIPFHFEVATAPKGEDGTWLVEVRQEGAEGPFAAGWKLEYRERDGDMVLHRVAVGSEPALEAELASIVLGPQFPYEVTYTAPPKDRVVNADELLDRAALPPGSLPGAGDKDEPGATPPARAPRLDGGGAPEGGRGTG